MRIWGRYFGFMFPALLALVILCLAQAAWAVTPRICTGANHTVMLRSDGTIWTTGSNSAGQLGDGSGSSRRTTPVQAGLPANATNWVAVAAGTDHTLALKADGSLWAWGANQFGQLGDGSLTNSRSPIRVGSGNSWTAVAAGGGSSFALKGDGTLWAWGANSFGQLGNGDPAATPVNRNVPVQVLNQGASPYVAIVAGSAHALALQADGSLWGWGANQYGQIAQITADLTAHSTPVQIGSDNDWALLAAGSLHSLALKADGTLWAWGRSNVGQLGIGITDATPHTAPVQVGTGQDWLALAAGELHTLAVKSDGSLWAWGDNTNGQLGDGTITDQNVPIRLNILSDGTDLADMVAVAAGALHSLAARADGELYAWGGNGAGQLGDGTTVGSFYPFLTGTDVLSWVASEPGGEFTVARRSNGTLWTWGDNGSGQLGDNTFTPRLTPVTVGTASNWVAQAAGWSHTLALRADGTLWAWGDNTSGQLGDGTTNHSAAPKQITLTQPASATNNWKAVAAGDGHTLALKADGTLWAWGDNSSGQLGDTTTVAKSVPVQIDAGIGNHWVAIAAGGTHSLGLQSDGTLWAWGDNSFGQLGDAFPVTNSPQQVVNFIPPTLGYNSSWVAIAAGMSHSMALQADGALWAWGSNFSGQLGNGDATLPNPPDQAVPVQVLPSGTSLYTAISAGDSFSVARQADGTLWSWGSSLSGQLGIGVTDPAVAPHPTPVREIGAAIDWVGVDCGGSHAIALNAAGTLWSAGSNSSGQLGDGTVANRNVFAPLTEGHIVVVPTTVAYGTIGVSSVSVKGVTLGNTGTSILTVSNLSIGGTAGAAFSLTAGTCGATPFTIPAAGSCTVDVSFASALPTGAKDATLTIASDDPNNPTVTVDLSGTSVSPLTITASVSAGSPAGSGTITPVGAVSVLPGSSQAFAITPANGFFIQDVVADGISQGPVANFTFANVTAAHTIVASFTTNFALSVNTAGTGTGSVASSPAGISIVSASAGASQSVQLLANTNVTLTATPDANSLFAGWSGSGAGACVATSATCTLTMTAARNVTATFNLQQVVIAAAALTGGTITPAGVVPVNIGASQTFAITPDAGFQIASITVDGVAQPLTASYTFTNVTANHAIDVTFQTLPATNYTITATAGANGSITPSGTVTVSHGGSQSFAITPAAGYRIAAISVDDVTQQVATSYAFSNVTANHTIAVTFAPIPMRGDVDGDGVMSIGDALMALRIAVGLYTPTQAQWAAADVAPYLNGTSAPDGQVTAADAVMILRKMLHLIDY